VITVNKRLFCVFDLESFDGVLSQQEFWPHNPFLQESFLSLPGRHSAARSATDSPLGITSPIPYSSILAGQDLPCRQVTSFRLLVDPLIPVSRRAERFVLFGAPVLPSLFTESLSQRHLFLLFREWISVSFMNRFPSPGESAMVVWLRMQDQRKKDPDVLLFEQHQSGCHFR
jgi:hypothetical protein